MYIRTLYLACFGYRRAITNGSAFSEWGFIEPPEYFSATAAAVAAAIPPVARRRSRERARRGPEGHGRGHPHALPGAARGDSAARRVTDQSEIDGAVIRDPAEVVLLARGTGELAGKPVPLLVVRACSDERDALLSAGHPFFASKAGRDRIVVLLTDDTDWEEIGELVTESYRILAPKVPHPARRSEPGEARTRRAHSHGRPGTSVRHRR